MDLTSFTFSSQLIENRVQLLTRLSQLDVEDNSDLPSFVESLTVSSHTFMVLFLFLQFLLISNICFTMFTIEMCVRLLVSGY